jgi:hypothetical protein
MLSANGFQNVGGYSSKNFLSDDRLRELAPTVFAEGKHASRSDRYQYIPTMEIVKAMRNEGLAPVRVQVARVRDDARNGFEKHLIRFRHVDALPLTVGGGLHSEVQLVNSHDGTTSYKISAGLYRLVCNNGLTVASSSIDEVRVQHTGKNIIGEVIEGSYRVLKQSEIGANIAQQWAGVQLEAPEVTALAVGAHHLRFADAEGNITTPIEPQQLLRARRTDDQGADLWRVFNRIQENAIKGGLHGVARNPQTGRRRNVTTKGVKSIDGDLQFNRALWKMAEHLAAARGVSAAEIVGAAN